MKERIIELLNKIESKDNFAKHIYAGLENDKAREKMLNYLESSPDASYSDVVKKLSDIRGVRRWNAERGEFSAPEE